MSDIATLFIDESGKSSLADNIAEPFLLTGIILENKELQTVEGFFNYIKRKFALPLTQPFHSYDIYENPKTRITTPKTVSNSLAEFISLIPTTIIVAFIKKDEFRSILGINSNDDFKGTARRKEMKDYPYRILASYIFALFAKELEKRDCRGQILADSRKGGDYQLLKTLQLCKEGQIPYSKEFHRIVQNRVSAICFAEKGFLSGGLEITDFISYVSFFRVRRMISQAADLGFDTVWKSIREKTIVKHIDEASIRHFFNIKKGEVHKYLK